MKKKIVCTADVVGIETITNLHKINLRLNIDMLLDSSEGGIIGKCKKEKKIVPRMGIIYIDY